MNKLLSFFRVQVSEIQSYQRHIISMVITAIFLSSLIYLFSSELEFSEYSVLFFKRVDTFSYFLTGLIIFEFSFTIVTSIGAQLRNLQINGVLEEIINNNNDAFTLISMSVFSIYRACLKLLIYLLIGILFFDIHIDLNEFFLIFLTLAISSISLMGLSIIGASFVLFFKSQNLFNALFTYVSLIFGGVMFSSNVLPINLHAVSNLIPLHFKLESVRMIISEQLQTQAIYENAIILLILGLIYFVIGIFMFKLSLRIAKKEGSIFYY